jgi:hypothetical protein
MIPVRSAIILPLGRQEPSFEAFETTGFTF